MTATDLTRTVRAQYLLPYQGLTRSAYECQLDRWLLRCAELGLEPLLASRTDLEQYAQHLHLELGLKASSVHAAFTPIRGFYRFAHYDGHIDRDPAYLARRPRHVNVPHDTLGLDRDQMRAFLAAGTSMGSRYEATAYLLACMALRAAEACSITIENYARTVRGHRVMEFTGKGGVPARMPLPVPVLRALEAASEARTTGPVILRRDGLPLSRQGLRTITRTIAKRAGIATPVTPHLLRHSCITNALESGAPLRKVQDLARHAEPRTTMRYDRNRSNLDDHAVHSLVAFLSPEHDSD